MENQFAEFKPIEININPSKEDITQYYLSNNMITDNDFLNDYLGLNSELTKSNPISENSSSSKSYNIKELLSKGNFSKTNVSENLFTPKVNIPKTKNKITDEINSLSVPEEDKEFLIKMASAESGFNPYITNSLGYYGLYQFGKSALKAVGMKKSDFDSTKNQHVAALELARINEEINKDLFDKYVGTIKNGVLITRNGLRAVHALLGAKGSREWLEGGNTTWTAKHGHKDAYGTGPETYLKMFI